MGRQVDMDLPDTDLPVDMDPREDTDRQADMVLPVDTAAAMVAQATRLDTLSVIAPPTAAAVDTAAVAVMAAAVDMVAVEAAMSDRSVTLPTRFTITSRQNTRSTHIAPATTAAADPAATTAAVGPAAITVAVDRAAIMAAAAAIPVARTLQVMDLPVVMDHQVDTGHRADTHRTQRRFTRMAAVVRFPMVK